MTIHIESGRIIRDPAGHPVRMAKSVNIDAAYDLLFKRLARAYCVDYNR